MRVLVTGSRYWANYDVIRDALCESTEGHSQVTVVHGAAHGADTLAGVAARELGFNVEEHPAEWSRGSHAGKARNVEMVQAGADWCLAFFLIGAENRGTRHCSLEARWSGIPVAEYWLRPSGEVHYVDPKYVRGSSGNEDQ